jgi:hypothetical protein
MHLLGLPSRSYTRNESHFAQRNCQPKSLPWQAKCCVLLKYGIRARKQQQQHCNTAGTSAAAIKPPANARKGPLAGVADAAAENLLAGLKCISVF